MDAAAEAVDGCELCAAAPLTTWYHECEVCWVAECESCAVPMAVWRRHGLTPGAETIDHMRTTLSAVAQEHFGFECWLDDNMRSIPDHYHVHARPKGGFTGYGLTARRSGASGQPPVEGSARTR